MKASRSSRFCSTTTLRSRTRSTPPDVVASGRRSWPRRSRARRPSEGTTCRPSPASPVRSTTRPARSGSHCRRAFRRLPEESRSSTSPRTRWRSVSASTGSPDDGASRWRSAHEIAALMVEAVVCDLKPADGTKVLPFVNGMGGTPQLELYLLYGEVETALQRGRPGAGPPARRQLHHVPRDGWSVAHAARAR